MSTAMQLRHAVTVTAGATPASGTPEYWDGEIPWVTPEDVGRSREGYWLHNTRRKLTEDGYANCGATLVPDHSIVLTKRAPIGQLAVLSMEACCNQGCFLLSPRTEHDARFVYYLLTTQADLLQALGRGSTFMELATDDLKALKLTFPPFPRQRAIAAYLDRETAKIDAMIAAKERLLTLLAEKRRALITHAVTRGLNPDAPMKDSGVEWLGEIPEHWNAAPLRYLVDVTSGSTPDKGNAEYWGGDIPWVSPKDMKRDRIDDAEDHVTDLAMRQTTLARIPAGSVLVVIRGMILAHSFPTAVTTGEVTINQDMKALRCRPLIDPEFLWAFFRGIEKHVVSQADQSAHGTKKIDTEILGAVSVVLPPLAEQRRIVQEVISQTARVDELVGQTQRSIDLGRERRSALIASAVTGQIVVEDAA